MTKTKRCPICNCWPQPTLKVPEVAKALGKAERSITRMCETGELDAFKAGRPWRIRHAGLDAYILAHTPLYEEALV